MAQTVILKQNVLDKCFQDIVLSNSFIFRLVTIVDWYYMNKRKPIVIICYGIA